MRVRIELTYKSFADHSNQFVQVRTDLVYVSVGSPPSLHVLTHTSPSMQVVATVFATVPGGGGGAPRPPPPPAQQESRLPVVAPYGHL